MPPSHVPAVAGGQDQLRKSLIALVAALTVALGIASYSRFGPDSTAQDVASTEEDSDPSAVAAPGAVIPSTPTTAAPTTIAPTTVPTTTSIPATTSNASTPTAPPAESGVPAEPTNVTVVSTGPTSAEIRWQSEECVGSRYQVGDFEPGGGGYPEVNRCWFNHVVLAGNESFSPALTPNTDYVVRIQAVNEAGAISAPVEVSFRTTSG